MAELTDADLDAMRDHTAGPWSADPAFNDRGPTIWAGGMLLAQIAGWATFDGANARLIAAAPALLAEVRRLRARAAALEAALGHPHVQWGDHGYCLQCLRDRGRGHREDCPVGVALGGGDDAEARRANLADCQSDWTEPA